MHPNQTAPSRSSLIAALTVFALALGFGHSALAQAPAARTSPPPAAAPSVSKAGAEPPSSGGVKAGLVMHGHWVIDVKNPDGKLVTHREFENSIQQAGQAEMIALLAGDAVTSDYAIGLNSGSSAAGPCANAESTCYLVQNATGNMGDGLCNQGTCFPGLTETVNLKTLPYTFVLGGSMTANQAGVIGNVYTESSTCFAVGTSGVNPAPVQQGSVTPAACSSTRTNQNVYGSLTGTSITPISVVAGQYVQVTVTISFS